MTGNKIVANDNVGAGIQLTESEEHPDTDGDIVLNLSNMTANDSRDSRGIRLKLPGKGDRALGLEPILPGNLQLAAPRSVRQVPGAWVQRATYRSAGTPLVGQSISIRGLEAVQTDVLLRIELLDGSTHSAILRPNSPTFEIPARESKKDVAVATWKMGISHILEGFDHLLFLLALMLIVTGFWKLVKTITAFTVAHSITLALATLGVVHFPTAPTEAVIALSIVFLAAEVVRKRQGAVVLTERYPWVVAFGFGLIHGLGFAGALSQIGIPPGEVPLALLMFNLGVETGQLAFVIVVALVLFGARRVPVSPPRGAWRLVPYAIGGLAAFWTIQRLVSMLPLSV